MACFRKSMKRQMVGWKDKWDQRNYNLRNAARDRELTEQVKDRVERV